MKKRIVTALMALVILVPLGTVPVYAGSLLENKTIYYTDESDYMDGDCILTATRMMIKRSAIMNNTAGWNDISNESLRPAATMDGLLLYSFSYEEDGVRYDVDCGPFKGQGSLARIGEFESLLEKHPEGIVVWGADAAETGTHGVLVVKVENGIVYAMDSSYNMGMFSEGIQKWADTTMLDPSLCTDYWYISDTTADDGATDNCESNNQTIKARHFNLLKMRITIV